MPRDGSAVGQTLTGAGMRRFSFGIRGLANLSQLGQNNQEAPASPAHQPPNPLRRRLEDAVEDLFHTALRRGDLASAEDLLCVMENIHARARVRSQSGRKSTALMLARARNELASRKARRRPYGQAPAR